MATRVTTAGETWFARSGRAIKRPRRRTVGCQGRIPHLALPRGVIPATFEPVVRESWQHDDLWRN